MNTPQHITHRFNSPLARDLFTLGAETSLAHKAAAAGHVAAIEREIELLNEMAMICEPPPPIILTDEEMAEQARYEEARSGRVNPHD